MVVIMVVVILHCESVDAFAFGHNHLEAKRTFLSQADEQPSRFVEIVICFVIVAFFLTQTKPSAHARIYDSL